MLNGHVDESFVHGLLVFLGFVNLTQEYLEWVLLHLLLLDHSVHQASEGWFSLLLLVLVDGHIGEHVDWIILNLSSLISLDLIDSHLGEEFLECELWLSSLMFSSLGLLKSHGGDHINERMLGRGSSNESGRSGVAT